MIDIHSHILYGIDDGAKTLEDSEAIIKSAIKNKVSAIFLTPHYILESKFMTPNNEKKDILQALEKKFSDKIKLYLGNEIYINNEIEELIKKGEIHPLGDSNYLLVELPVYNEYPDLEKYLFHLQDSGYKVIIAHPERYFYFKNDIKKVIELCEQGIYFQGNYMSLYNIYSRSTRKLFIKLLMHHCYTFMASDIHSPHQKYYSKIKDAEEKVRQVVGKKYTDDIFFNNAAKIISGEEIKIEFKEKISIFDRIRGNI